LTNETFKPFKYATLEHFGALLDNGRVLKLYIFVYDYLLKKIIGYNEKKEKPKVKSRHQLELLEFHAVPC
jgi:hypothetical protein